MRHCLFFGDSITFGEYDGVIGGWVDMLKKECLKKYNYDGEGTIVFNLGIGGETTEGLVSRIENETIPRMSDSETHIFIAYGANDIVNHNGETVVKTSRFRSNLEFAIDKAKKSTTYIYLINILPIAKHIDAVRMPSGKMRSNKDVLIYNSIINEIAKEANVSIIDLHSSFVLDKERYLSKDGLHPNDKGYHFMYTYMKSHLDL